MPSDDTPGSSRRRFLARAGATLGAGALAGCTERRPSYPWDDGEDRGSPTGSATGSPLHAGYETTEVRVETPDGDLLGAVTAAIADTFDLRYLGLSDTETLPEDRGMLFVYDAVSEHTFVMREMDFGLDIVYADDEGVITRIHHAPAPGPGEDGEDQRYPGTGQYVLEVNLDWTTDRGIETGDVLAFDR